MSAIDPRCVDSVRSAKEFVDYVNALVDDLDADPSREQSYWSNRDLRTFLMGMANWVADGMELQFARRKKVVPPPEVWQFCAELLEAGSVRD
jgi:hypothetical protein